MASKTLFFIILTVISAFTLIYANSGNDYVEVCTDFGHVIMDHDGNIIGGVDYTSNRSITADEVRRIMNITQETTTKETQVIYHEL